MSEQSWRTRLKRGWNMMIKREVMTIGQEVCGRRRHSSNFTNYHCERQMSHVIYVITSAGGKQCSTTSHHVWLPAGAAKMSIRRTLFIRQITRTRPALRAQTVHGTFRRVVRFDSGNNNILYAGEKFLRWWIRYPRPPDCCGFESLSK